MPRIFNEAPLSAVVVFSIGATRLWSGRAKLVPEDFGDVQSDLPPAAIASLGSKRLFPKEKLKQLDQIKRKKLRVLSEFGSKFTSAGYAVAEADAEIVAGELNKLDVEGNKLADDMITGFDQTVKEWHAENPEWKNILAAGTPEKEHVRSRIRFDWDCYMLASPKSSALADKLGAAAASMGANLYREISKEAADFVAKSLTGDRNSATQRTIKPLQRLVRKLDRLSFLDPLAFHISSVCNTIIAIFPSSGKITDSDYLAMIRLANLLADADAMQRLGQRVADGLDVPDAAAEIIGTYSPTSGRSAAGAAESVQSVETAGTAAPEGGTTVVTREEPVSDDEGTAEQAVAPSSIVSMFDDAPPDVPVVAFRTEVAAARRAAAVRSASPVRAAPPPQPARPVTLDF